MDMLDADVMDDLMYDAAEGPTRGMDALDDDAYDEYDEGDAGDEGDDEFIGRLLGGASRVLGGLLGGGGNGFDEGDAWDEADAGDDTADYGDEVGDAIDDLVADALDAGDSDEFLRRLGSIARSVGRGIGSAARVIGPLANMIPLPQAQMIGRIANVAGRLLADGADEFEALDELVDNLDDSEIDAAAPVIAGLALRRVMPAVARLARPARRQLVRGVARATRTAARRAGPRATRIVPRVVRTVQRAVRQRRISPRAVPRVVQQVTQQVVRRPQAVRRLARPLVPTARRATPRGTAAPVLTRRHTAGGTCPRCGGRHITTRGPVTITIQTR